MMIRTSVAFALSLAALPNPGYACSVERIPDAAELVRRAEVIVRIRAEGLSTNANRAELLPAGTTQVRFVVLEVIKGTLSRKTIEVSGSLSEQDDRNDRPVPYDFVRRSGRHGNCFALEYRQGAEYVLMLAEGSHPAYGRVGDLTPYWAPLAATNEQVSGPDDPWVAWVRKATSGLPSRPGV